MELSKQVTSLELSKKLKELGVKQESYFQWYNWDNLGWQIAEAGVLKEQESAYSEEDLASNLSAFTVAELGELLPKRIQTTIEKGGAETYYFCQSYTPLNQIFIKYHDGEGYNLISFSADTEADARAAMLIYLLENNLLTPTK